MTNHIVIIQTIKTAMEWGELMEIALSDISLLQRYTYCYELLHRLCTEMVQGLTADYTDFFSRLQAVCRLTSYPLKEVDGFRWRARRVIRGEVVAHQEEYAADLMAACRAIAHFTNSQIPQPVVEYVAMYANTDSVVVKRDVNAPAGEKSRRYVVIAKDSDHIYGVGRDVPSTEQTCIDMTANEQTSDAFAIIEEGMQVNVVSFTIDEAGVLHPDIVVIDPDFLIDVSALTSCVRKYGDSPANYLVKKFQPMAMSRQILLGEVANQFLDDCINNPDVNYADSIRKAWRDYMISFSVCDGIDKDFFAQCEQQFKNISTVVSKLRVDPNFIGADSNVLIEPSFFCETLGLQGRLDALMIGDRQSQVIELKSGKYDEWNRRAAEEHLLQMIMYKEILYYNLGIRRPHIGGYLLYSKYPYLLEQRTAREMVEKVMTLRNRIVCQERALKDGKARDILDGLEADDLNTFKLKGNFWTTYCRPPLNKVLAPLSAMDQLTSDYFYTFLQFVEREQYLAKVGDGRIESTRGMAALWNADVQTKLANGDMLMDLRLVDRRADAGIEAVCMMMGKTADVQPNFRVGDAVILYERAGIGDTATTKVLHRCSVERYSGDCIWLRLRHVQSNPNIFAEDRLYAIEHDHIESTFGALYRGLHTLVTTPADRRNLLLCQRMPAVDTGVRLIGNYINQQINDIVLRSKQAQDYFLLIGPPGTGKTSVALKAMVHEYLASGCSILLMAYTNRAVDEICEMLDDTPYLRLPIRGNDSQLEGRDKTRDSLKSLLMETRVYVSTVASMHSNKALFDLKKFDVAIFDEASQILEPQLLDLLCSYDERTGRCHIDKFIMIGDHKQLPAVVVQGEDRSIVRSPLLNAIGLTNCRDSLFQRLHRYLNTHDDHRCIGMLQRQGRMHPRISDFASARFYDNVLLPVPIAHQRETLPYVVYMPEDEDVAKTRMGFIDIPLPPIAERQPKVNMIEATRIARLVMQLVRLSSANGLDFDPVRQIGIIVPFRRQITAVRRAVQDLYDQGLLGTWEQGVEDMMIDTVERYQGSQRDVIIYGTTITQSYELDILSNIVEEGDVRVDRKLNVAVTRARKQLFVVGNAHLLSRNALYASLIEYADRVI